MRNLPSIHLARLPRMADFASWATAGERAMGLERGAFMAAYNANRAVANERALKQPRCQGNPRHDGRNDLVEQHGQRVAKRVGTRGRR